MPGFRIYYGDGAMVEGRSKFDWLASPDTGIQVVVDMDHKGHSGSTYNDALGQPIPVYDRWLWTGEDTYDPFKWGIKQGKLIPDDQYFAIWKRACTDGNS